MKKNKLLFTGTILLIFTFMIMSTSFNNVNHNYQQNNIKANNKSIVKESHTEASLTQNQFTADNINNNSDTYELNAKNLSYDNSKTGLDCKDVQCVIDEITKKLNK